MITQLAAMLKPGDTVTFTLALEADGQLRLNIFPKLFTLDGEKGEQRKALNQPLTVTGAPADFDGPDFLDTITKFTASATGLRTTLDEAEAAHADSAKSAKKDKADKPAARSAAAKPLPEHPAVKLPARPKPTAAKPAATEPAPEPAAGMVAKPIKTTEPTTKVDDNQTSLM